MSLPVPCGICNGKRNVFTAFGFRVLVCDDVFFRGVRDERGGSSRNPNHRCEIGDRDDATTFRGVTGVAGAGFSHGGQYRSYQ